MTLRHHLPLILQPRAYRRSGSSCLTFSTTIFFNVPFSYAKSLEEKVEKMENLLRKVRGEVLRCDGRYQWTLANPSPGRIAEAIQTLPEDAPSMLPALVHSLSIEEPDVEERDHALEFTRPA